MELENLQRGIKKIKKELLFWKIRFYKLSIKKLKRIKGNSFYKRKYSMGFKQEGGCWEEKMFYPKDLKLEDRLMNAKFMIEQLEREYQKQLEDILNITIDDAVSYLNNFDNNTVGDINIIECKRIVQEFTHSKKVKIYHPLMEE